LVASVPAFCAMKAFAPVLILLNSISITVVLFFAVLKHHVGTIVSTIVGHGGVGSDKTRVDTPKAMVGQSWRHASFHCHIALGDKRNSDPGNCSIRIRRSVATATAAADAAVADDAAAVADADAVQATRTGTLQHDGTLVAATSARKATAAGTITIRDSNHALGLILLHTNVLSNHDHHQVVTTCCVGGGGGLWVTLIADIDTVKFFQASSVRTKTGLGVDSRETQRRRIIIVVVNQHSSG
jgi:hypothetical protein